MSDPGRRSFLDVIRDGDEFFERRGKVYETLARITRRLKEEEIPFALIGGMAVAAHGFNRFTEDVDLLTTPEGLRRVHERLVGRGFVPAFPGSRKRLRDTANGVIVEFITTGEYPGDGKPKAVGFPDPESAAEEIHDLPVITLPRLIELKLTSGMTMPHRLRDLADVQDLIAALRLPLELGEQLDPSVREKYREFWYAIQNATGPDRE